MLTIRRILVPTDFSPHAKAALDLATELARKFGAELILAHAVPPPAHPLVNVAAMALGPDVQKAVRQQAQQELDALVRGIPAGVTATTRLLEGVAFHEILECAGRDQADLIVIGTQGHTGLKHVLLGSTAERVVRLAPMPVLTIRAAAK